jgi:hypothetical protein
MAGSHDVLKPFIMDSINQGVTALNKGIDDLTTYIRENGVAIGILFLIFYYIRNSGKKKVEGPFGDPGLARLLLVIRSFLCLTIPFKIVVR